MNRRMNRRTGMDANRKAMYILQKKVAGMPLDNEKEWVLVLGDMIQISWIDETDSSKSVVVDIRENDFHPFTVNNNVK